MRSRRSRSPWSEPEFPTLATGRSRVVVENSDTGELWAATQLLTSEGYDVVACEGPPLSDARRCPLVTGGSCAAIGDADVVVSSMLGGQGGDEVIDAIRNRHPRTPVIVVAPPPVAARHTEHLDGCQVVSPLITGSELLAAVQGARKRAGAAAAPARDHPETRRSLNG